MAPSWRQVPFRVCAARTAAVASPRATQAENSGSNPTILPVPDLVTIAPGNTTATFALNAATVTEDHTITLTAKIGATTVTKTVTIHASNISGMTITPNYVLNLNTVRCTITLDGPAPAGGLSINLTNSNNLIAAVPTHVTVPAGQSSVTFSIATYRVTRTLMTTITAAASNGGLASATLTVHN